MRKLSDADVITILRDRRPESEMAARFGVKPHTINRIRTGARRADVAPDFPRWFAYVDAANLIEAVALRVVGDPATHCWNWTGKVINTGYGQFSFQGESWLAHRAAFEAWNGPIPEGMSILHRCDNRRCCNPGHLFAGTQDDNISDCVAKGRHHHGERHNFAKLTAVQVREIRAASGKQVDIARDYGVSQSAVSYIKTNRNWSATL